MARCWTRACNQPFLCRSFCRHSVRTNSFWIVCYFLLTCINLTYFLFSIVDSLVSWRLLFWVMMVFAGVCTTIMIILLPETYAPVILLNKKDKLSKEDTVGNKDLYAEHERQDWSFGAVIRRTIFRPFHMLALEPILVMITIYFSIVYGLLFGRKQSSFFSFVF